MSDRRQRLVRLASAAAFLAIAVVAVLIVVSQSQTGGGDASHITDVKEVRRQLSGIPQHGLVLGDPDAKVAVLEFADLQCPFCRAYSEEVLPQVIENQVRGGEAKLDFRNYTIIGPQSTPAGAAAIAAGEQGRGWDFVELFYRNQGTEDTGYVSDEFLTAVARAAGVPDIAKWNHARQSGPVLNGVAETTAQAEGLGFSGTPSIAIQGPGTKGVEALGEAPSSAGDLESAVSQAG
ncbi:MAG TPA: thioredoxin domain-containing protein [Solirubrobacterales bacterium]|nr:thioredoxin domain-containing protein [Solirubrobacterales bacterium]